MSIIDCLMPFFWFVAIATGLLIVLLPITIVRWWFGADRREAADPDAPRVHTRLSQSADWNGERA
jgi:hypothetical protein